MSPAVAVIDIGSNSIKVLVAARDATGQLVALKMKTLESRISAGISHAQPRLSDEGIARGMAAVKDLLAEAATHSPAKIELVATSAVRDAANGGDFREQILRATGHTIRILTGDEEANLIGRGLTCDPALRGLRDFYLFDLGGGSLECLAFRNRTIQQAVSLPLGCVRMTERCVNDPNQPIGAEELRSIVSTTREILGKSGFHFSLPPQSAAVGTGGTLTSARAVLGARRGKTLESSDSVVTLNELRELLAYTSRVGLEDRRRIPGMPHGRADVLPAALATIITLGEIGGFNAYLNSVYNLRWGIADSLLPS